MTTLPAVVRVVDLPVATTITGSELFEVIQTASGVGLSVQVSLTNAIASIGSLPAGGTAGQVLTKSSATNYDASFTSVISTSLGVLGTTLVTGTFGVVGTATFTSGAFNVVGTTSVTGAVGITGTTLITGTLFQVGTSLSTGTFTQVGAFNVIGTAAFSGVFGVTDGTSTFTSVVNILGTTFITGSLFQVGTATFTSGAFGVTGTTLFTSGAFGVVGTTLVTGILGVSGKITAFNGSAVPSAGTAIVLASSTAGFGIYIGTGVPSVSAATGSIYLRSDGATATSRMYVNNSGTGTWTGVTTVA